MMIILGCLLVFFRDVFCLLSLLYISVFVYHYYYFFFFKQKTAYEMRISDWSSDVCSSDLLRPPAALPQAQSAAALGAQMEEIERNAIREALQKTRYNKTRAAELLGMSFRALRYRIKKLGLDEE